MTPGKPAPSLQTCTVWRCRRRSYTYLYLREDWELSDLPPELARLFHDAEAIMELDLAARDRLANAEIAAVRRHLADPGYYVQLPPNEDPSGWLDLPPDTP